MTESIKTRVRATQNAAFAEDGTDPAIVDATRRLYDAVDALSAPQRRLLIDNALHAAQNALRQVNQPVVGGSFAFLANGLLALAGYAVALDREERNETSTGDLAVTDVLDSYGSLTELYVSSRMSPEEVQRSRGTPADWRRAMSDECQAVCWMDEWADDAMCCLPPGHEGPHWDQIAGWEW